MWLPSIPSKYITFHPGSRLGGARSRAVLHEIRKLSVSWEVYAARSARLRMNGCPPLRLTPDLWRNRKLSFASPLDDADVPGLILGMDGAKPQPAEYRSGTLRQNRQAHGRNRPHRTIQRVFTRYSHCSTVFPPQSQYTSDSPMECQTEGRRWNQV